MALGIGGMINLAMMAYSLYQKNQELNMAKDASNEAVEADISGGKKTDSDELAMEDKLGDTGADFLKGADNKTQGLGFGAAASI